MYSGHSAGGLLLGVLLAGAALAAHAPRVTAQGAEEADVENAVRALKADPHLERQQKTVRHLVWKDSAAPPKKAPGSGGFAALFEFLAGSMRLLIWVLGALVAAFGVVWTLRALQRRAPRLRSAAWSPATQVQNLDVRPASLPADVGAAAAALLAAGQVREALSLLYRGALSRAIHRHGIAIAESSTEGEVLAAVAPRLPLPGGQYFGRLVPQWQRAVYAAEPPAAEIVAALCRDFPLLEAAAA